MTRKPVFVLVAAALAVLPAVGVHADVSHQSSPSWLQEDAADTNAAVAEPVFVAGIDSGGAGEEIQPGPECRLAALCVDDSQCRQIHPGFYACVWLESATCMVDWCY